MLQGLTFFHHILELLLDFFDPGLELLTGGLLLDSLLLGLAQGLGARDWKGGDRERA